MSYFKKNVNLPFLVEVDVRKVAVTNSAICRRTSAYFRGDAEAARWVVVVVGEAGYIVEELHHCGARGAVLREAALVVDVGATGMTAATKIDPDCLTLDLRQLQCRSHCWHLLMQRRKPRVDSARTAMVLGLSRPQQQRHAPLPQCPCLQPTSQQRYR